MSNGKVIVKSGIWYTISNFLLRGIGFITTPIFTRLLTQEEFGAFNNYTSWLSILIIIVTLNIEATLISARFEFEDRLDEYIFSVLTLSTLSTLVWVTLANVFMNQVSGFLEMSPVYVNSMFVYLLFYPAINLFQTRERYFYRYKTSVFLSMFLAIGASALSVIWVVTSENRLSGRVYGYVLPTILVGLIIYILLMLKGKRIVFSDWKYALKVCIPYIPHLLSLTVLSSTDRIMITKFCGERDTALYSLAYNVAMLITMLLSALNGAFSPWLGENLAKKAYGSIRKMSKYYIAIFAYLTMGIMLLAPEILLILGGEKYMAAKPIMIPVALGCMCQFLYTLFVNVEQFSKKTIGMAFASASAAILNYVLNLWLIPKFGYEVAAYTTLIGYIWLLLIHMILVYALKLSKVYSYKFVFATTGVMAVVALGMNYLYANQWIRFVAILGYILCLLVFLYINKVKLAGMIKKSKRR